MHRPSPSHPEVAVHTGTRPWHTLLGAFLPPTLLAVLVWFSGSVGYLLAHTLAEVFSIVVAITALVVATTARKFTRNHYVIFVSVAIGWCAGLDLVHTLVFKGMQLLASDSANPATQLWIAARFMQALALAVAPFMLTRVVRVHWLHGLFGALSLLAVLAIFSGHFPDAFIDGQGLTPFKIYTEYLIIALLGLSLLLLWQRRRLATPKLRVFITAAVLLMMASEFAFTRYASVYAVSNLLGHVLKIYAYWFVYLALVQTTLQEPFSMLSRVASSYDAVPDPTLIVTLDGSIVQANQAAARHAGLPVEALVGRSSHQLFHDASVAAKTCPVCARLASANQAFVQVLELPQFQFMECSVAPVARDVESQACVQVVRDITEQHASEERFRKLFEDTRQAVSLVEDGHFVAANRAALAMLRMDRLAQFIGRTPMDISPPRQPDGRLSSEKVAEVIATAFERGANEFEWEHLRADGEPFIARVLLTPIRMGGKDLLHVVWSDITRQKQAEKELDDYRHTLEARVARRTAELESAANSLRSANAQQQAVFDAASVGIMLTRNRVITSCNRTLEHLFGYAPGELPGCSTAVLYGGEAAFSDIGSKISAGFASRGLYEEEREVCRKDGSRFLAHLMARPIDPADPAKGIAGTIADITAERAAQAALHQSNEQLTAIFDAASLGIMLIRERRIVQCNRRLEAITGYDPGELVGQATSRLYADAQAWAAAGQEIYSRLAAGEPYVREHLARRKDGSTRWVRLSANALEAGDLGKGIVGLMEDISAERLASEALRKAADEQQAVFDAATVGIVLTRDRQILRCNRTMERLFGYAPEAMIGLTTRVLYPDDATYADVSQRLSSDLSSQGYFQEERELVRQDGSFFWCRKMVRVIDRSDPDKGFAGTFENITAEHQAIAEMARARALAEDAARTKAEFLANMSHEIRTPMNSVVGMTLLALKQETSPKVRDYLQKIQSSSQHLLGVINDILDFSKLDANKMVLEQAEFVLEEVLGAVNTVFAEKIASKGLELVVRLAPDVPQNLLGDSLRIEQVLINLVSNAVKFTERGQIDLQVDVDEREGNAVLLRFAVQDTGIGLTVSQQQQLFSSFQQADTSITRKYGGSGLGLVISQRLVSLMGGQIGVESTPGQGSTFWFTARLAIGSERPMLRIHPDLHGLRMLVVDDNALARQVIVEMLGGMGFEVNSVATGPLALEDIARAEAAGSPYDLVLLDWKMPQMDGLAVAREIQRQGLAQPPMLLMITAFDRDSVQLDAVQVGIREVLVKPVTPSVLFNAVMRQFGKSDAEPRVARVPARDQLVETAALAGAHALLVEDNPLNQEVATEFLKALGMGVELAPDGAVALEKVQHGRYDVVLMDMQMPVMDGITATQEIRKLAAGASLPIIAMTANAQASDRERCLAAGMNDHIAKPIDPDDLVRKLTQWVKPVLHPAPTVPTPVVGPAAAGGLDLRGVAGLDPVQGLKLAMGRESLYRHLLEKFVVGERDWPARMADAFAGARWDEAERLAHTLKGVSAQIGAEPLRQQAQALERAIRAREGLERLEPLCREIADQLAALIDALDACLPPAEAPAAATVDPEHWRDLRERLASLLRFDDAASVFLFEENQAVFRAALGQRFAPLAKAIGDFEFAQALALLQDPASYSA